MKIKNPLEALHNHFKKRRVLSARAIADFMNTYPATAKRRVEALIRQGVKLREVRVAEGARGPASRAWELVE